MKYRAIASTAAFMALIFHQGAWAQEKSSCIAPQDAEAVVMVFAPSIIGAAREICLPYLPDTSALAQAEQHIDEVLEPAARLAFPSAKNTFSVIDRDLPLDTDYETFRSDFSTPFAAGMAEDIDAGACASVDKFYSSLSVLKPQQMAALIVSFFQLTLADDPKRKLPICQ